MPRPASAQARDQADAAEARPSAQDAAEPVGQDVEVRTWLTQTAMWVGDRVTYTIEIACRPKVDILVEDVTEQKLRLDGLEVLGAETERRERSSGGVTYQFRFHLTTYEVDARDLRIGGLTVRAYVPRPGTPLERAVPTSEVRVPGAGLAWRSTIPDELEDIVVRDRRSAVDLPVALTLARPVGLGLILLSVAPVGLWVAALIRRRQPRTRRNVQEVQTLARAALSDLHSLDISSEMARREAYAKLDMAVRRHVTDVAELPAASLTAAEVVARLRANGSGLPADAVGTVLTQCAQARYGRPDSLPASEQLGKSIAMAEQILITARR